MVLKLLLSTQMIWTIFILKGYNIGKYNPDEKWYLKCDWYDWYNMIADLLSNKKTFTNINKVVY